MEEIKKIISIYGKVLPDNKKIDCYTFKRLINVNFSPYNPLTQKSKAIISKNYKLSYLKRNGFVTVFKEK